MKIKPGKKFRLAQESHSRTHIIFTIAKAVFITATVIHIFIIKKRSQNSNNLHAQRMNLHRLDWAPILTKYYINCQNPFRLHFFFSHTPKLTPQIRMASTSLFNFAFCLADGALLKLSFSSLAIASLIRLFSSLSVKKKVNPFSFFNYYY